FKKCTQVIDPETKRFSPKYDEEETMTIPCDRIVFAIGQSIDWGNLLEGRTVKFHHGNYPMADALTYQTDDPEIFVGGDVLTGPKFVIDAIAAGHYAAESLHRAVRWNASMTIGRDRHDYVELNKDDILVDSYDTSGRQEEGMDLADANPFKDIHRTLSEEQVHTETSRCLSCGASVVDPNKCIGCGICTTRCQFDAIHLYRDHPEMTDMRFAEDKVSGLAGYAVKRAFRILANAGSQEAKMMRAKRKEYNRTHKEFNKKNPYTGNSNNA
ncbi:MAG: 4Fe-4S binding protein, partial [Lachnospiraceae bacterium]|uniref:4Fe-4S binding protein n=1 Tax=Galactobacillus timonensis TaxID=2041840 RepID=UPI0023F3B780